MSCPVTNILKYNNLNTIHISYVLKYNNPDLFLKKKNIENNLHKLHIQDEDEDELSDIDDTIINVDDIIIHIDDTIIDDWIFINQ